MTNEEITNKIKLEITGRGFVIPSIFVLFDSSSDRKIMTIKNNLKYHYRKSGSKWESTSVETGTEIFQSNSNTQTTGGKHQITHKNKHTRFLFCIPHVGANSFT